MTLSYLPPTARTAAPPRPAPSAVMVYIGAPEGPPGSRAPDLPGLARAVERLVHSLAPDVVTRVTVALPPAEAEDRPAVARETPLGARRGTRTELGEGLALDHDARVLLAEGRRRPLTRREFDLLAYLDRRRGVALSRRELMTQVWGTGYLAGDRTIDVHVRRLRVKLGRHADRITTLRGYGYRFD